jgi:rare lipoprotein A (peptidoglycan hydrolase)
MIPVARHSSIPGNKMPFINGKFYMNPAYGRAVERARDAEGGLPEDEGGHWVTINGRHLLIQEGKEKAGQEGARTRREKTKDTPQRDSKTYQGRASFYELPGRKTASGQQYDADKMAAAMTSEKVKLGQVVTVTYTHKDEHGNTTTNTISMVVNDRGPFAVDETGKAIRPLQPSPDRVIDLTPAAFKSLVGTTKPGVVPVIVTVPND